MSLRWPKALPILLRTDSLEDAECIGIEHFVRQLHKAEGALEVPERYRDRVGSMNDEESMSDEESTSEGSV